MQAPGQIATATDIAEDIGEGPARSGFDFATGFDPTLVSSQYEAGAFDPGYTARRVRPGYTARDLESQYAGDINIGPGFEAGTIADAETLEQYMNPYQQLVTDTGEAGSAARLGHSGSRYFAASGAGWRSRRLS